MADFKIKRRVGNVTGAGLNIHSGFNLAFFIEVVISLLAITNLPAK